MRRCAGVYSRYMRIYGAGAVLRGVVYRCAACSGCGVAGVVLRTVRYGVPVRVQRCAVCACAAHHAVRVLCGAVYAHMRILCSVGTKKGTPLYTACLFVLRGAAWCVTYQAPVTQLVLRVQYLH